MMNHRLLIRTDHGSNPAVRVCDLEIFLVDKPRDWWEIQNGTTCVLAGLGRLNSKRIKRRFFSFSAKHPFVS